MSVIEPQQVWETRLKAREDREWSSRTMDERAQIAKLQGSADYVFQASGQMMPSPRAGDSVDGYRIRLIQALCPSTYISPHLAKEPEALEKLETGIAKQIIKTAHELPELRPIFNTDETGRVVTEFIGSKRAWMDKFKAVPQLGTLFINGTPARHIPQC